MGSTLLLYAAYLAAHLLLYILALRRLDQFRSERTIFLYHLISALALTATVVTQALVTGASDGFVVVVAAVSLHGIYSMSFLELWSLAEGGYSLQILEHVKGAERRGAPPDVEALRAIGIAKQADRLGALTTGGLARQERGEIALEPKGRIFAGAFALLAWLTNVQDGV